MNCETWAKFIYETVYHVRGAQGMTYEVIQKN